MLGFFKYITLSFTNDFMKSILSKILRSSVTQNILAFIAYLYIKLVFITSRWEFQNHETFENYVKQNKPFIISFWHGHLLMMACAKQWKKPVYMLISNHRDGKIISKVMKYFGIYTIAGSTDKQGFEAARIILEKLKQGSIIGITPDGPRGPREVISNGVLQLARLGQVDVIPIAYSCKPLKCLRTWDYFRIAKPFCKGIFVIGEPVTPQKDLEQFKQDLQHAMDKTVKTADNHFI